jgi:hypothetical protein
MSDEKIEELAKSLKRWFDEKWTDQYGEECGSGEAASKDKKVKCRPSKRVSSSSPQTWNEMSSSEKKKAVSLKQKAHKENKQFSSHKTGKTYDIKGNKYSSSVASKTSKINKADGPKMPTPDVNTVLSRHSGVIPEDHPDRKVVAAHINKLWRSDKPNDKWKARGLYDKHISPGGGGLVRFNKSITFIPYSDGSLDVEFDGNIDENLEKNIVSYLESKGYEELLNKGLKAEHKSKKGGMTAAGVKAYRSQNPGSKLQTAVTEDKPTGKRAKRRKSFCSRMSGVPGPMKDKKGRPTRKALALRRWKC